MDMAELLDFITLQYYILAMFLIFDLNPLQTEVLAVSASLQDYFLRSTIYKDEISTVFRDSDHLSLGR